MQKLDHITNGIGELYSFDNIEFVKMFELDDITRGIGELDFFENIGFVTTQMWAGVAAPQLNKWSLLHMESCFSLIRK